MLFSGQAAMAARRGWGKAGYARPARAPDPYSVQSLVYLLSGKLLFSIGVKDSSCKIWIKIL